MTIKRQFQQHAAIVAKMLIPNSLYLILNFVGIMISTNQAQTTSCQVYPSEYAYRHDSVNRSEPSGANCRRYPESGLQTGVFTDQYIHCDGMQRKLIDLDIGQEQYLYTDYYWWSAGRDGQLLFIFPTRVSLTTITLHYYSDSHRGLPRLRFYAVLDNFDVWDSLSIGYRHTDVAEVPPGGEPGGHRNISISVNFSTRKALMYKYSSTFLFSVSEVEFLTCEGTTTSTSATSETPTLSTRGESDDTLPESPTLVTNLITKDSSANSTNTTFSSITDSMPSVFQSKRDITTIGVAIAILLLLSTILVITVVVLIWIYKRRSVKQELYTDSSYSILSRDSGQQIQPQSIQHDSAQLYDQIHLSPSTGQTEFVPKPQSENINNPLCTTRPTHPDAGNYVTSSAESQTNSPLAIYAAIDKSKKRKVNKEDERFTAAEKGPPVSSYTQKVSTSADKGAHASGKDDPTMSNQKSLNDMHTSDHKDQEKVNSERESNPHTVEELYTAVKKKPKGSSVPANEQVSQVAEDLYTAVMKESSINNKVVPPIPPHTVEELYTAVQKKPKGRAVEDEEEAPPIHPYTAEDTS